MIGLELSLQSEENHRAEIMQTLENLSREQASDSSCVDCRVYEDLSRPNGFLWLQWWRSEGELQSHLSSREFRTLLGAIKVLAALGTARIVELQDSTSVLSAFLTDRVDITERPPGI